MAYEKGFLFLFVLIYAGSVNAEPVTEGISLTIPPGGYAWSVVSDSVELCNFGTVNTFAPGPLIGFSGALPDSAIQAIQLSAEWLRSDLEVRFTDLLYRTVYNETPVAPAFADVNGDGFEDLILGSGSSLRAFTAPRWAEFTEPEDSYELRRSYDIDSNGEADSSYLSSDGVLTIYSGDSILQVTEGFDVPTVTGTALGDMEGDSLADLVVGTEAGNVLVFRNRGTFEVPCFLPFFSESRTMFPMNAGAFSSSALFSLNDSTVIAAVGT